MKKLLIALFLFSIIFSCEPNPIGPSESYFYNFNILLRGKCFEEDSSTVIERALVWVENAFDKDHILAYSTTDEFGNYNFNWNISVLKSNLDFHHDYFLYISKGNYQPLEIPINISDGNLDTNTFQYNMTKDIVLKRAEKDTTRPYVLMCETKTDYQLNTLSINILFSEEIIIRDLMLI